MEQVIKELKGHSGSRVYLLQDRDRIFVRKIGDVQRNYERLISLNSILPVPEVYSYDGRVLDMEYIHGLDVATYLTYHNPKRLADFLIDTIDALEYNGDSVKDYTQTYWTKLSVISDWTPFTFTMKDLIDRLPHSLPQTNYYGDLTLENVLYDTSRDSFVLIDPLTSEYDSFVFDIAKLSQDIVCEWFIRNKNINLSHKLGIVKDSVFRKYNKYMYESSLTILMLLRVFPYCKTPHDREFIIREANRLWM
jgi:hypothetical protein